MSHHSAIPGRPDLIRLGLGIVGIGTSGPLIALSAIPVSTLIFWRNLGGAIVTAPFAFRHKEWRNREAMKWAIMAGVLLALHFLGFFFSMRMTSVAAGTAITALQPIFAALFVKIGGGHIPSRAWLGMAISFLGVLLITGVDLHISMRSFFGDLVALACGAFSALYVMVGSKARKSIENTSYTTVCYFVCALTVLPIIVITKTPFFYFPIREWWIVLGLIVGAQILGHSMFNSVLKRVSPAIVSLIVFFEVPVAAILAYFWLGQSTPAGVIPGIVIILIGCSIVVIRTRPADEVID
ncbi:MAG: EamA family transporter [Actinobacteria bacterium]|uniref:Unannotated protein n=1 Tax=freshwater metagenome TaxID=449393 RepID=A0A6J7DI78_9ZZZZ|nr:EamA family transporter [Actinomycetota bacterium]MSX24909.1 EamA family transporter [Actinomycetota bacterium]MSY45879.1 EamA family transporter [Actinomycetota bacterium]MSY57113.1 EamA family transporter [Actinomycetota bacterium]MTB00643.1 EamA family transporter [Actinomycetota bacterium]